MSQLGSFESERNPWTAGKSNGYQRASLPAGVNPILKSTTKLSANAAIDQDYEVNVADQFVSVDNDALFRCQIAPGARDFLQVVGWLDDQQHLIAPIQPASLLASTRIGQKKASSARALLLPDGQLYVARVQPRDANKSYRCQVKNLLNSRLSVSSLSGRLYVTGEYLFLARHSTSGECERAPRSDPLPHSGHTRAHSLICAPRVVGRASDQ